MNIHIFFQRNRKSSGVSENEKVENYRAQELKKIFNYERDINGEKYGKCIKCLRSRGFETIIKMKNSNTSGIKCHLKVHHWDLFEQIYNEPSISKTQVMNLLFSFILY